MLRKCQPSPAVHVLSYSPHSSASSPSFALEGENQSSGLGCFGLAGSHVSPLAWQLRKGASWERGIWLRLRWGMQPGLGVFSQALLGRLLKVTPTSNKKSFQTQRKSQPGQCQVWLGIWIQKSKSLVLTNRPEHPGRSPAPTPGMPGTYRRALLRACSNCWPWVQIN